MIFNRENYISVDESSLRIGRVRIDRDEISKIEFRPGFNAHIDIHYGKRTMSLTQAAIAVDAKALFDKLGEWHRFTVTAH